MPDAVVASSETAKHEVVSAVMKHQEDDLTEFADGDIDGEWIEQCENDLECYEGMWELIKDRSESCDHVMKALGVGMIKRNVMKNATPGLEIPPIRLSGGRPDLLMISHLPLGNKKEGQIFLDGVPYDLKDSDTGDWQNTAKFVKGRLLQKRVSDKGVMYDVRSVFKKDPESKCQEKPIMLFKWTFLDKKGNVFTSKRWFKKKD